MGRRWEGGIHEHPSGWWANVPKKAGGRSHRKFFSHIDDAKKWQDLKGREEWGIAWPDVKSNGAKGRILTHHRKAVKFEQIEPGLCVSERIHPIRQHLEKRVLVTYMERTPTGKRQRTRSFTFDSEKSNRTREQAIEAGRLVLKEKRKVYANRSRKNITSRKD